MSCHLKGRRSYLRKRQRKEDPWREERNREKSGFPGNSTITNTLKCIHTHSNIEDGQISHFVT